MPIFEYFPYYSSRAHKFLNSNKSTIRNSEFKKSYENFLVVSLVTEPTSARSRVTFIYYLLLQDRIEEAYTLLQNVSQKDKEEHEIQFDYIESFLDMYKGYPNFNKARKISQKYLDYPVETWRKLFAQIAQTLKDYDSDEFFEQTQILDFRTVVLN